MILLPDGGPLFRGLLKAAFCDKHKSVVKPEAYLRRESQNPDGTWNRRDQKGISVAVSPQALTHFGLTMKAIATIQAAVVRSLVNKRTGLSLEIYADPPLPGAEHGNIVNIPYLSEDRDTAEYLAGELARNSNLIPD